MIFVTWASMSADEENELFKKLESEKIDITLPSYKIHTGSPNILEKVIEEIEELNPKSFM